jgi:hypothetical protein
LNYGRHKNKPQSKYFDIITTLGAMKLKLWWVYLTLGQVYLTEGSDEEGNPRLNVNEYEVCEDNSGYPECPASQDVKGIMHPGGDPGESPHQTQEIENCT